MGIPETTIRSNFGDLLSKKRAERKLILREKQNLLASGGNPAMLIFLGKNDLGQTDKQETKVDAGSSLAAALAGIAKKAK